jgi:hypothetical protein
MSTTFLEIFEKNNFFFQTSDIPYMEGFTMPEMAKILGIDEGAVQMRLHRAGIKPLTTKAVYPVSALEIIRNVPVQGQHKKAAAPELKPASKSKKATK